MARVRIVLVRPGTSANVGACARIVRNTGAAGLDLVAPGDWRTVDCWRTAWGAHEVLEEAREFGDLEAALAGASMTVALTGRRPAGPPVMDVREAAAAIGGLGKDAVAALVFGPETSGLTNDEIAECGSCATIPSHPGQASFNLSHAVAIASYEVFRASRRAPEAPRPRATHDEKERLLGLLREGLLAIEALPRVRTDGAFADWRSLVQRCELTASELKLVEHAARKMMRAARPAG
ncbi:MAG TPA: RNA methyltransferase [Vicinamibacteria bacterium]|nr:RNA methyltransferase [Vicinamibacteria bacterium]